MVHLSSLDTRQPCHGFIQIKPISALKSVNITYRYSTEHIFQHLFFFYNRYNFYSNFYLKQNFLLLWSTVIFDHTEVPFSNFASQTVKTKQTKKGKNQISIMKMSRLDWLIKLANKRELFCSFNFCQCWRWRKEI